MIGAIAGDMIGSVYEWNSIKTKIFPLFIDESEFTDDTVLTVAVADLLLNGGEYVETFHRYFFRYPNAGYGAGFRNWCIAQNTEPYNSWGNGSAMRVSPVGYAFNDLPTVLSEAERSAAVTHNHPEGIRGAQATAAAILWARQKWDKADMAREITSRFGYELDKSLDSVRYHYVFDVSCAGTVPWAIRSFLEAEDFEDTIRNAISLGGDADTLACIAGGIAGAYYGVPDGIRSETMNRLDGKLSKVVKDFCQRYEC